MFKDKTFKCRVCDSCGKIIEIPEMEDFPAEEFYEVKNFKTGRTDEVCDDCWSDRAFVCCICGGPFYNTDKFVNNGFYYCPECAEKKVTDLGKEYFSFVNKFQDWKKERDGVKE